MSNVNDGSFFQPVLIMSASLSPRRNLSAKSSTSDIANETLLFEEQRPDQCAFDEINRQLYSENFTEGNIDNVSAADISEWRRAFLHLGVVGTNIYPVIQDEGAQFIKTNRISAEFEDPIADRVDDHLVVNGITIPISDVHKSLGEDVLAQDGDIEEVLAYDNRPAPYSSTVHVHGQTNQADVLRVNKRIQHGYPPLTPDRQIIHFFLDDVVHRLWDCLANVLTQFIFRALRQKNLVIKGPEPQPKAQPNCDRLSAAMIIRPYVLRSPTKTTQHMSSIPILHEGSVRKFKDVPARAIGPARPFTCISATRQLNKICLQPTLKVRSYEHVSQHSIPANRSRRRLLDPVRVGLSSKLPPKPGAAVPRTKGTAELIERSFARTLVRNRGLILPPISKI